MDVIEFRRFAAERFRAAEPNFRARFIAIIKQHGTDLTDAQLASLSTVELSRLAEERVGPSLDLNDLDQLLKRSTVARVADSIPPFNGKNIFNMVPPNGPLARRYFEFCVRRSWLREIRSWLNELLRGDTQ